MTTHKFLFLAAVVAGCMFSACKGKPDAPETAQTESDEQLIVVNIVDGQSYAPIGGANVCLKRGAIATNQTTGPNGYLVPINVQNADTLIISAAAKDTVIICLNALGAVNQFSVYLYPDTTQLNDRISGTVFIEVYPEQRIKVLNLVTASNKTESDGYGRYTLNVVKNPAQFDIGFAVDNDTTKIVLNKGKTKGKKIDVHFDDSGTIIKRRADK